MPKAQKMQYSFPPNITQKQFLWAMQFIQMTFLLLKIRFTVQSFYCLFTAGSGILYWGSIAFLTDNSSFGLLTAPLSFFLALSDDAYKATHYIRIFEVPSCTFWRFSR